MLTLWQTALLRRQRLAVVDEVVNGLAFYDYTFLRELPRLYAALDDQLACGMPARLPPGDASVYAEAGELVADLDVLHRSLVAGGSAAVTRGRLRTLRRGVDVFGFHLATLDLRQNADVHERTVGELLEAASPGTDYGRLGEEARIALLLAELATSRPLTSPFLSYSAETTGEIDMLHAAAGARRRYGANAISNYIISKAEGVSDVLEVLVLLKEVGLYRPRQRALDLNIVPLFETIGDLRRCVAVMERLLALPPTGACSMAAADCRR